MTNTYHVHLDRTMRLTFWPVQAATPEDAAAIARQLPTDQAVNIEDSDGVTLAACVVPDGEPAERSETVEFVGEWPRAAAMRAALEAFLAAKALAEECGEWKREYFDAAFALAREALARECVAGVARAEMVA